MAMVAPLLTEATALHAQLSMIVGGAALTGSLQTPYVRTCSGDAARAFGMMPYVGVELNGIGLTAGYLQARKSEFGDCIVMPPVQPPDGSVRIREFRITHGSIYGWAFHLRYAPATLPLMAHVGSGIRFGGNELGDNRFVSYGLALRTRGRLGLIAGVELTQLRTRYFVYNQTTLGGEVVSREEVDRGFGWRKLEVLRFGVEYRLRLTGK